MALLPPLETCTDAGGEYDWIEEPATRVYYAEQYFRSDSRMSNPDLAHIEAGLVITLRAPPTNSRDERCPKLC
jgi:hypothetical protein